MPLWEIGNRFLFSFTSVSLRQSFPLFPFLWCLRQCFHRMPQISLPPPVITPFSHSSALPLSSAALSSFSPPSRPPFSFPHPREASQEHRQHHTLVRFRQSLPLQAWWLIVFCTSAVKLVASSRWVKRISIFPLWSYVCKHFDGVIYFFLQLKFFSV